MIYLSFKSDSNVISLLSPNHPSLDRIDHCLFCASKICWTAYYYSIYHTALQVVVYSFILPVNVEILQSEDNTLFILASPSQGSVPGSQQKQSEYLMNECILYYQRAKEGPVHNFSKKNFCDNIGSNWVRIPVEFLLLCFSCLSLCEL